MYVVIEQNYELQLERERAVAYCALRSSCGFASSIMHNNYIQPGFSKISTIITYCTYIFCHIRNPILLYKQSRTEVNNCYIYYHVNYMLILEDYEQSRCEHSLHYQVKVLN